MQYHKTYKHFLWIGVIAALAIPAVPVVFLFFFPPDNPIHAPDSWTGIAVGALDTVTSFAQFFIQMLIVATLAFVSLTASIVALVVSICAKMSAARKCLSALPVLMAALTLCLLMGVCRRWI